MNAGLLVQCMWCVRARVGEHRPVEFVPFARAQMDRLGLTEREVRRLVDDAVMVIPIGGGKVMHEALLGGMIVSVIVRTRPRMTVVALTMRTL